MFRKHSAPLITLVTMLALSTPPAQAAGVAEFFKRLFQVHAPNPTVSPAVKNGLGEEVGTGAGAMRSMREILKFSDNLEAATNGLLRDISARVESGHFITTLGRGQKIDEVLIHLNNPGLEVLAIEGSEGVGKTQILIGLQERIRTGAVPAVLKNSKVIQFNSSNAMSSDIRQIEAQLDVLANTYAKDFNGVFILSFSEIEFFLTESAKSSRSFSQVVDTIIRKLGKDRIKIVIEGTPSQVSALSQVTGFGKNLGRVKLSALSTPDILDLAKDVGMRIKAETGMSISNENIEQAVRLSEIYLGHIGAPKSVVALILGAKSQREVLMHASESPLSGELRTMVRELELELGKAKKLEGAYAAQRVKEIPGLIQNLNLQISKIDERFLALKSAIQELKSIEEKALATKGKFGSSKELAELVKRREELSQQIKQITPDEMALWIRHETGTPVDEILRRELTMDEISKTLNSEIFGQEKAVAAALKAAERSKDLYRTSEAPLSSILLIGPPGNGKTELSKTLARILGGLIRFDGSEFMQSHQVARLIGAPPGYVGFDASEPGLLIREANRLRKGVVLLDEINMFHEDILKMLYQIAGEGRATGSNGTTASFKDFVIMMTMNPNAPIPENATREELIEFLIKSTNGKFTSAMLNRFDEIVLTNKLDRAVFSKILNKEISRLNASMAKDLRQLRITKEAEAAMLEPFLKGEVTSRDLNRMVRTVVGDPINRLRNSGLWRGKDGLDHELRFADGDLVELDYSAATGYVWRLVK